MELVSVDLGCVKLLKKVYCIEIHNQQTRLITTTKLCSYSQRKYLYVYIFAYCFILLCVYGDNLIMYDNLILIFYSLN